MNDLVAGIPRAALPAALLRASPLVGAVGPAREPRRKAAGFRTSRLICVGATLLTEMSVAIGNMAVNPANADPGRIAAQIVSGIGFLGAGTIIQAKGSVIGLTTAATMWVLAGIGLAIGSGVYAFAIVGTAVLLVTLSGLGWLEGHLTPPRHFVYFHILADRRPGLIDGIN